MTELAAELQHGLVREIGAEQVRFDYMTRLLYSTDASNYQIMPVGVLFPRHGEDVQAIMALARDYQVPVLPRGAGTSLAGQTVGTALVLDFSRYMRRVRSINVETASVVVEPGLVLDHLNRQVQPLGLMFGPDPASSSRATIGGCIGNNSTGAHSILYGMTADHVRRLEVVRADGERLWLDASTLQLEQLRRAISQLHIDHRTAMDQHVPKTWRNVAGYALHKIDPAAVDLTRLVIGSEGTLAIVTQAELALVQRPAMRRLVIVHFDSLRASLEATPRLLETSPAAIELIDRFLLDKTRQNPHFAPLLTFVEDDPAAILLVEYYGTSESELTAQTEQLQQVLKRLGTATGCTYAITPQQQAQVWEVRKAGLNLLTSERSHYKPIEFIEDAAVPVERLADYVRDVEAIIRSEGTTFAIYAHASAGCLHIRPLINLNTTHGMGQYRRVAEAVTDLVIKYQGTITGEHSEGLVRGEFSQRLFGAELTTAFETIKDLFDPQNLLNPGKKVRVGRMDDLTQMRQNPAYAPIHVDTRFDWSADLGLIGAIDMCNGSGVCRKEGTGTMCPSYMATHDEAHATRGRANALRQAMTGQVPGDLSSDAVHAVFDLCLMCKACKSECPSSVDVARMKAELLAARHDALGTPVSSRLFGNVHRLNQLGSLAPALTNWSLDQSFIRQVLHKTTGLPITRPLPRLAKERFSYQHQPLNAAPEAILLVDTFTEYNHPQIGRAVLKIAARLGLHLQVMRLPGEGCCGRPAISKGLLDQAKKMAIRNVEALSAFDLSLLFIEPSCQSALIDDYLTLIPPALQPQAQHVAERCISVERWLIQHLAGKALKWDMQPRQILLHGHCHQKSLWSTTDTLALLRYIPEASVREIDAGCCGMAGSFGYEHPEVSRQIANQRLIPALAAQPDAVIAATGTSCRDQVADFGYQAFHPVEIVAEALL